MGQPAAKQGDTVQAMDTHTVVTPSPAGPVSTPTPLPFNGALVQNLSQDVKVMGRPAATVGSVAMNQPPHVVPPPASIVPLPNNQGRIVTGSATVFINGKPAARNGDSAVTCTEAPGSGKVIAAGTVLIG